jgi:hypothetical protein
VGAATFVALASRAGPAHPVTIEVGLATMCYAALVTALRRPDTLQQKLRVVAAYGYVLWFYLAVARITPALGTPLRDAELYAADCALFGETPAVSWQPYTRAWPTEVFSAAYLSYHGYLHLALIHGLLQTPAYLERLAAPLMRAFAVGFAGYLLVPAVGPVAALSGAFSTPLPGGAVTRLNDALVAHGSSVYDVFPSLHVLVTCVLLDHDWQAARRRFWLMLLPAGLLVASTLYLRYHYAIDLIAGLALFLVPRLATGGGSR